MENLSNSKIIAAYKKSFTLDLDEDFQELLKAEIERRGIIIDICDKKEKTIKSVYTILLVDHSSLTRERIKKILNNTPDYKVIAEASNGKEAILKFTTYRPDIVIMDMTMDEISRVEVLKYLVEVDPKIKVVMCSTPGQGLNPEECLKMGATAVFVKSNFKKLIGILEKTTVALTD